MNNKYVAVLVWIFLSFWLISMVAALFAGNCLRGSKDLDRKLLSCTVASKISPAKYSRLDHPKYAAIELERAIALADSGRLEESAAAMRGLRQWVTGGNYPVRADAQVVRRILSRVRLLDKDSDAFRIFSGAFGQLLGR